MTVELMPPSETPTTALSKKVEKPQTEAEKRQERLAQALRANLRRRKAQKRGRADGETKTAPEMSSSGSKAGE